jgi:hypothetical protein
MSRIVVPRAVLLVEIERRCSDPQCKQKARIGLTKEEARHYTGFVCERCERETLDSLAEREVPVEWWQDFVLTGTNILPHFQSEETAPLAPNSIKRLSDAYRKNASDE